MADDNGSAPGGPPGQDPAAFTPPARHRALDAARHRSDRLVHELGAALGDAGAPEVVGGRRRHRSFTQALDLIDEALETCEPPSPES